ncbi:MAG: GH92 family glycosyl hydrolase [candidate division WOR-3 bacterium]|nr:MAG: GH92 family glycosyl hydrolase [candidate division WOR-3 bacterium]UCF07078.1 MAG: GH92 family glycosyl hydrolase [bacterium]
MPLNKQTFVLFLLTATLLWSSVAGGQQKTEDYSRYVDPMIGTHKMGHTFPGATVPFGMVQLSPDTRHLMMYDARGQYVREAYRYCSGYQYEDSTIFGFSHTHFSGTGHSDLGDISLMPTTGILELDHSDTGQTGTNLHSRFRHDTERAEPGYYMVTLDDFGVDVELTTTTRVGLHRYTFAKGGEAHVILDMMANIYNFEGKNVWTFLRVENDTLVTGYRQTTGWARTRTVYFVMAFSQPMTSYGHRKYDETPYKGFYRRFDQESSFPEMAGREIRAHFDFDVRPKDPLLVKVALSSVSTAGALRNLQRELPHWDFDRIRGEARQQWNRELGRVDVESLTRDQQIVFYTALYHTMLGPVVYEDVDGQYRGLDQNVHTSDGFTNYTIFSLWDTYRALHPLFNLIQVARNTDMINSMLAHYDQSVHPMLPIWSHYANENWCMIGYHAVSVIADAVAKTNWETGLDRALKACVTTSRIPYFDGVGEYMDLGYVPDEASGSSVSITLELAYDDWCIAQLASQAGNDALYNRYMERSRSYRNVYDPDLGFMRPKKRNGTWREDFNTMETHGQGFIEGNAWNYSLYVPHDPETLVETMGGPEKFSRHLDELFEMELPDEFIARTEDITRDGIIGNYVHGNEPGHHIAYLYNWTDRPWQTQARVRMIMDTMYGPGVNGLCGNDDAGQMSAWYIFSALGFYTVCPGSRQYAIGSPLVARATLNLENGNTLVIRAEDQDSENVYVQKVEVNGKVINRLHLEHDELVSGGEIVFFMGPEPNRTHR